MTARPGLLTLLIASLAYAHAAQAPEGPHLVGWAALPSTYRTPGPASGHFIEGRNGVVPPFQDGQPVPGFSGLLTLGNDRFLALPDNGYGAKGNSADFILGFHHLRADFARTTASPPTPGNLRLERFIPLRDPLGLLKDGCGLDIPITADLPRYRSSQGIGEDTAFPVDPRICEQRLLTGYDFDPESIARAPDGTLWIGDEFGPWLLHFSSEGELLQEPVPHPFLLSPSHPRALQDAARATLPASRGFEAISFDAAGRHLYVTTEAVPTRAELRPVPDDERVLALFEFEPARSVYTGRTWLYRKDGPATANDIVVADLAALAPRTFLVLERDNFGGPTARLKRIYRINLDETDADGLLRKTLVVDLLAIPDPKHIGSIDGTFKLPFVSVESIAVVAPGLIAVANDTNYPNDDGRHPGRPDETEIALLSVPSLASPPNSSPEPIAAGVLHDAIAARNAVLGSARADADKMVFVAFWDFDGTLLHGDCSEGLTEAGTLVYPGLAQICVEQGLSRQYPPGDFARLWDDYQTLDRRIGHWLAYPYLPQMLHGARAADVRAAAAAHFERTLSPHYFTSSLQILRGLEAAGIKNYVISASADVFVDGAATTVGLPIERLHGIEQHVDAEGHLTTELIAPVTYGEGKLQKLLQLVAQLHATTPGRQVLVLAAFGNSYGTDGPFLEYVARQTLPGGVRPIVLMINGGEPPARYLDLFNRANFKTTVGTKPSHEATSGNPDHGCPLSPPKKNLP